MHDYFLTSILLGEGRKQAPLYMVIRMCAYVIIPGGSYMRDFQDVNQRDRERLIKKIPGQTGLGTAASRNASS